jgi:hypothetical protein
MREIQFEVLPRYNAMAYAWPKSYFLFVLQQIRVYLGWWSVLVAAVALLVARRARDLSATLPVFLATAMGLMCTAMQGRLPSFAFETCFPFFAMLWGYLAVKVFQGFRHISRQCWSRGFRLAAVLVWIVLANLVYLPLPDEVVQFKLDVYNLKSWYTDRDSYYRNYPWARPNSHFDGQIHAKGWRVGVGERTADLFSRSAQSAHAVCIEPGADFALDAACLAQGTDPQLGRSAAQVHRGGARRLGADDFL